ncbi:MAG: hypothetical protein ACLFTT_12150 [Candidatus Hydrogenedentota bacterium]
MVTLLLLAIIAAPEQIMPVSDEDIETYRIVVDAGGEERIIYGTYEEGTAQVNIVVDAPWTASRELRILKKDVIEVHRELKHKRRERRIEQAKDAGFAYVESAAGAFFVPERAFHHAQRAREMVRKAEAEHVDHEAAESGNEAGAEGNAEAAQSSSLFARYGWHAGIVLTGVLLLAGVVRFLILA